MFEEIKKEVEEELDVTIYKNIRDEWSLCDGIFAMGISEIDKTTWKVYENCQTRFIYDIDIKSSLKHSIVESIINFYNTKPLIDRTRGLKKLAKSGHPMFHQYPFNGYIRTNPLKPQYLLKRHFLSLR